MSYEIINSSVLDADPGDGFDAVFCDPPYGLSSTPDIADVLTHWLAGDDYKHSGGGFMGKAWDSFVPGPATWRKIFDAMKPGAHLMAFGGTRTFDLLSIALRLAGLECRDTLSYLFATGFPKNLDVSKAIDKAAGAEREIVGRHPYADRGTAQSKQAVNLSGSPEREQHITAPATPDAIRWEGHGTALKPSHEPIILARKPLDGTVAANCVKHGCGGINIEGGRIEGKPDKPGGRIRSKRGKFESVNDSGYELIDAPEPASGRWPANLILSHLPECECVGTRKVKGPGWHQTGADGSDGFQGEGTFRIHKMDAQEIKDRVGWASDDGMQEVEVWKCAPGCPVRMLDEQSGESKSTRGITQRVGSKEGRVYGMDGVSSHANQGGLGDTGGASRFFFCAKTSAAERSAGLGSVQNSHPTLKPLSLCKYLATLLLPPKRDTPRRILCPFSGSGSEMIGAHQAGWDQIVGIESEAEYCEIAEARLKHWTRQQELFAASGRSDLLL